MNTLFFRLHWLAEWIPLFVLKRYAVKSGAGACKWAHIQLVGSANERKALAESLEHLNCSLPADERDGLIKPLSVIICMSDANGWSLPVTGAFIINSSHVLDSSVAWLAGELAFSSRYSALCNKGLRSLPLFSRGNEEAKREASHYSAEVLRRLGASDNELEHFISRSQYMR